METESGLYFQVNGKSKSEGFPAPGKDEISIQCYNGPADAEHWIRFDDFRITPLEK